MVMLMSFYDRVYEVVREIPKGKVATYGQIAHILGSPKAARAVGYALHFNPLPNVIPCHRVVMKNGALSKAFAFGGENAQRQLLLDEGVEVSLENIVNIKKHIWVNL